MPFHRAELAFSLAQRLLQPTALDEALRSGLFLSGQRRTGKSTFLLADLVPALQSLGAVVIYVDLWSDPAQDPAQLVHTAIRQALKALMDPGSRVLQSLQGVRQLELQAGLFKFGFKLEQLGTPEGPTLAQAFSEVIEQAQASLVLIVDEVQHALTTEAGSKLLYALKAARDSINLRPRPPGHFLFVGTGSHCARVGDLVARKNQAFLGAQTHDFPILGRDFVEYTLKRVQVSLGPRTPSVEAAHQVFTMLGSRPEELLKALMLVRDLPADADVETHLPTMALALRSSAADVELAKLHDLGGLAIAIFDRAARQQAKQLFSNDAAASYTQALGREVRIEEVQPMVNQMIAANVLMRRGHGAYEPTDAFVQQAWLQRHPEGLSTDPSS